MVGLVKLFGVLSIVLSVILFLVSIATIYLLPMLLPVAASALLGGALLIVFARIVEVLESIDSKLNPIFTLASTLEAKSRAAAAATQNANPTAPIRDPADAAQWLRDPPPDAQVTTYNQRRVVILRDGRVVAETLVGGARWFSSFEEFKEFIGS